MLTRRFNSELSVECRVAVAISRNFFFLSFCFVRLASSFSFTFVCMLSDFPLIFFFCSSLVGVSVYVLLFQVRVFWLSRNLQVNDDEEKKLESMFNGYRSFIDSLYQFAERYWLCLLLLIHTISALSLRKLWHRCAKN